MPSIVQNQYVVAIITDLLSFVPARIQAQDISESLKLKVADIPLLIDTFDRHQEEYDIIYGQLLKDILNRPKKSEQRYRLDELINLTFAVF